VELFNHANLLLGFDADEGIQVLLLDFFPDQGHSAPDHRLKPSVRQFIWAFETACEVNEFSNLSIKAIEDSERSFQSYGHLAFHEPESVLLKQP
jgi:hypothetical protein